MIVHLFMMIPVMEKITGPVRKTQLCMNHSQAHASTRNNERKVVKIGQFCNKSVQVYISFDIAAFTLSFEQNL